MTTSSNLTLTSEPNPAAADVEAVRAGLVAFNIRHVGQEPQPGTVNLFLRDEAGQVIGGLLGWWRWGWLYVDKLWVADAYRQRGYGSQLLQSAEAQAIGAGCTDAVLDTFSFQAEGFYERHGYGVYATLEGFPPGHRQLFLHKRL
ncbi:N-acetyltransferase [filamentous cyanobacterium CCT1]|nr:N-acetyltransferase [filamentous cyanobacterium CCT1]PSN78159.1 N-acetyltransferase [filamentous cyanobacterium CCP4]